MTCLNKYISFVLKTSLKHSNVKEIENRTIIFIEEALVKNFYETIILAMHKMTSKSYKRHRYATQILIDAENHSDGYSLIDESRRWVKCHEGRQRIAYDNYVKKENENIKIDSVKQVPLLLDRCHLIDVANCLVNQNKPHCKFDTLLSLLFDWKTFIRYSCFQNFELQHFFAVNEEGKDDRIYLRLVVEKDASKTHGDSHVGTILREIAPVAYVKFWLSYVCFKYVMPMEEK